MTPAARTSTPATEAFALAVGRLADRWFVVVPRWTAALARASAAEKAGASAATSASEQGWSSELAEQARHRLATSWAVLDRLAAVGLAWQGQPPRELPQVGVHVLNAVLLVLADEILTAPTRDDEVLADLTRALDDLRRRC